MIQIRIMRRTEQLILKSVSLSLSQPEYYTHSDHNRSCGAGVVWGVTAVGSCTRSETNWTNIAEAAKPELPTAKGPDISIHEAVKEGNVEAVIPHLDLALHARLVSALQRP